MATLRSLTGSESVHEGVYDYRTRRRILHRLQVTDLGDFAYRASLSRTSYFEEIQACTEGIARQRSTLLGLGGDHSVTLPLASGVARGWGRLQILHLDAHHDHAPLHEDTFPTHSNFISFLARMPEVTRIIQVGIRGYGSYLPERRSGPKGLSPRWHRLVRVQPGRGSGLVRDRW